MSVYVKWAGVAIIMLCALFFGKEYSAYVEKRLSQYRGFVAFIGHIEGMILRFLAPQESLWQNFSDEALEKCGFLPSLRSGSTLSGAFSDCEASLSLSDEQKERFSAFFADFGRDYMDGELNRASDFHRESEELLKKEEAELTKSVKITNTILIASALGIVILMI